METLEQLDKQAPLGAFSTFDMEVMLPELQKLKAGDIYLEVGVDKGKSLWLARRCTDPGVRVFGVDLQKSPEIEHTGFFQGDSKDYAKNWVLGKLSLLFIDGDHSYVGCKADIDGWFPHMKEGGVMMFHDCDESSPGVMQAVAEFVNTHKVQNFQVFKRTDKNTSMAKVAL